MQSTSTDRHARTLMHYNVREKESKHEGTLSRSGETLARESESSRESGIVKKKALEKEGEKDRSRS